MRVRLLCVGKPRDALARQLHDGYAERIARLGVRYETDDVPDVRAGGRFSPEHALEREAAALLERIGSSGTTVVLDRTGELIDTGVLAERIERWATPRLTLIVGGPAGLHRSMVERASHAWSLSRLTFPHELVRVLVAEQIYRALCVRRGIPYHR